MAIAVAASLGCGPALTQVDTSPAGAVVKVDGRVVCRDTPCTWESSRGLPRRYRLEISLPGYETAALSVDSSVGPSAAGFVIMAAGFGAWTGAGFILAPLGALAALPGAAPPPALSIVLPRGPSPPPRPLPPLPPPLAVDGRVLDAGGAPVEGAVVVLVTVPTTDPHEADRTRSDQAGKFRLRASKAGQHAVTVTAGRRGWAYVPPFAVGRGAARRPIEIRLAGGLPLGGTVRAADGSTGPGGVVRLGRQSDVDGDLFVVEADATGAYQATLPPATYGAAASRSDGLASGDVQIPLAEATTRDFILSRTFPAAEPPPPGVAEWLGKAAVPLATPEAGHGFADMQPLGAMAGDARVVALGEATHGSREFFQLKHRMLEYLVAEKGFTILGIEASFPDSLALNDYVLRGRGDPEAALSRMRFWTWDTEEVLALARWMRGWNADRRHTRKVKLLGFDMQSPSSAARIVAGVLRRLDGKLRREDEEALRPLADDWSDAVYASRPAGLIERTAAGIGRIRARFAALDARAARAASPADWALERMAADVLAQGEQGLRSRHRPVEGGAERDRSMAENLIHLLDIEGPGSRMVAWAHNDHVRKDQEAAMGHHLADGLRDSYLAFGFSFGEGSFQAIELPVDKGRGLVEHTVGPAEPGTLDGALAAAVPPVAAVDLRAAPAGAPSDWTWGRVGQRSIGAAYAESLAPSFVMPVVPRAAYDAVLFVRSTTRANATAGGRRAGFPQPEKRSAPANLDFEDGAAGAAPPGWFTPPPVGRAPYRIATVAQGAVPGSRAASIERLRSPLPWGWAPVVQKIDARRYRGKRVRLEADVRAETSGWGNAAALFVQADGAGARPGTTPPLAFADTLGQKIGRRWERRQVEIDVPDKADSLTFGLVLAGDGRAFIDRVALGPSDTPSSPPARREP